MIRKLEKSLPYSSLVLRSSLDIRLCRQYIILFCVWLKAKQAIYRTVAVMAYTTGVQYSCDGKSFYFYVSSRAHLTVFTYTIPSSSRTKHLSFQRGFSASPSIGTNTLLLLLHIILYSSPLTETSPASPSSSWGSIIMLASSLAASSSPSWGGAPPPMDILIEPSGFRRCSTREEGGI